MKKIISTGIVLGVAVILYGCFSVTVNFSGAKVPDQAKTFNVFDFINTSNDVQPGLTIDVTEALRSKIESQTSLKLTNGYGDITFEGEVYKYSISSKALTSNERSAESRFTIGLKVKYTSVYEPDNDFEKNFDRFEDFDANQTIESVRDELTEKILENLIDDIFKEAFVNW